MHKLELEDVSLVYDSAEGGGKRLLALDHVDLHVEAGEAVAVIGPSGCGKSSMLRMACGLLRPSEGRVLVDGEEVSGTRFPTSLILQDFGLLPWKTVEGNVDVGLKIRKIDAEERARRIDEALELVGLSGFRDSYPSELSGGMQQRLALARSMALDVDLLLMDEPLSALDALLREKMQDMLLELWKDKGYAQMLVTHSIEEAVYLGQRIIVMSPRPGRVLQVVENPMMGRKEERGTMEFFELCNKVRGLLDVVSRTDGEDGAQDA